MIFSLQNNFHILRILSVLIFAGAGIGPTGVDAFAQSGPQGITVTPKIVFGSSRNGGNHDIFTMDLDGSNQTRLTTSLAYDDQPKWSPDSSKIAFMSGRDGNLEIYTMNADGSGQTRITNNLAADGRLQFLAEQIESVQRKFCERRDGEGVPCFR